MSEKSEKVENKKITKLEVFCYIVFVLFQIGQLFLIYRLDIMSGNVFNFYIELFIISKVLYIVSFILYRKSDVYESKLKLCLIFDFTIVIIYALYNFNLIMLSIVLSIVFLISAYNMNKNQNDENKKDLLIANYFFIFAVNALCIFFLVSFIFYAFKYVPVIKHIVIAIKAMVKAFTTTGNVTAQAIEKVKDVTTDTIDVITGGVKNFTGFFQNIFKK